MSKGNGKSNGFKPGIEHRRATRYRTIRRCQLRTEGDDELQRSIVCEISETGVGVVLPKPVDRQTVLEIRSYDNKEATSLLARVVHSSPVQHLWVCGCEFVQGPLNNRQLRMWLAESKAN